MTLLLETFQPARASESVKDADVWQASVSAPRAADDQSGWTSNLVAAVHRPALTDSGDLITLRLLVDCPFDRIGRLRGGRISGQTVVNRNRAVVADLVSLLPEASFFTPRLHGPSPRSISRGKFAADPGRQAWDGKNRT